MNDISIRFMEASDLQNCLVMDSSYHTESVWQMEMLPGEKIIDISFREIKLPRSMRVDYPRSNEQIIESFRKRDAVLVGLKSNELVGFISISTNPGNLVAHVTDLVVNRRFRRQGIGSTLVRSTRDWALKNGYHQLQLEMQSKNFPAIELATGLGFEFCGFSDRYYQNQDIALFFIKRF